jgi:predicted TPR repeat methyltransferase
MGFANVMAGREEKAVELWERVLAVSPDMIMARIPLAYGAERDGLHEAARVHVREILRVNPEITAEQAVRLMQGGADVIGPELTAEFLENLRSAGLP